MAGVEEISSKYASELNELRCNSKPLINSLTMMAEDYIRHAPVIVQTIENHLRRVKPELKLPVLYLIDSIVKNVKKEYVDLFTLNIVSTFTLTFEQVNEKIKSQMWKLRQTWNDVFQTKKLYSIDYKCHQTDPGWPITAAPPSTASIHVNPKFLRTLTSTSGTPTLVNSTVASLSSAAPNLTANALSELGIPHVPAFSMEPPGDVTEAQMREQLLMKQKELLELQTKKLELELLHTKAQLEERTRKQNELMNKQPAEAQTMQQQLMQQVEMAKHQTDLATTLLSKVTTAGGAMTSGALPSLTVSTPSIPSITTTVASSSTLTSTTLSTASSQPSSAGAMQDPRKRREKDKDRVERDRTESKTKHHRHSSHHKVVEVSPPELAAPRLPRPAPSQLTTASTATISHVIHPIGITQPAPTSRATLTIPPATPLPDPRQRVTPDKSTKFFRADRSPSKDKDHTTVQNMSANVAGHRSRSSPQSASSDPRPKSLSPGKEKDKPKEPVQPVSLFDVNLFSDPRKRKLKDVKSGVAHSEKTSPSKGSRERISRDRSGSAGSSNGTGGAGTKRSGSVGRAAPPVPLIDLSTAPEEAKSEIPAKRRKKSGESSGGSAASGSTSAREKDKDYKEISNKEKRITKVGKSSSSSSSSSRHERDSTSTKSSSKEKEGGEREGKSRRGNKEDYRNRKKSVLMRNYRRTTEVANMDEEEEATKVTPAPWKQRDKEEHQHGHRIAHVPKDSGVGGVMGIKGKDELFGVSDLISTGVSSSSGPAKVVGSDVDFRFESLQDVDLRSRTTLSGPGGGEPMIVDSSGSGSGDQSPLKKPRNGNLIDDLFGREDVDLRQQSSGSSSWSQMKNQSVSLDMGGESPMDIVGKDPRILISSSAELDLLPDRPRPPPTISPANSIDSNRSSCDPLGRPLLYNRLPDDPAERKRSLDFRTSSIDPVERFRAQYIERAAIGGDLSNADLKKAVVQAQHEFDMHYFTKDQYDVIMRQLMQINEVNKIREVQQMQQVRGPNNMVPGPNPWTESSDVWSQFSGRGPGDFGQGRFPTPINTGTSVWGAPPMPMNWGQQQPRGPTGPNPFEEAAAAAAAVIPATMIDDLLPPVNRLELDIVKRDTSGTIPIDKVMRQVRFYDETAIVLQGSFLGDEPREISFQKSIPKNVWIDQEREPVRCFIGKPFLIYLDRKKHNLKLGAPTREFYIDGDHYEGCFGGPPVRVRVDRYFHSFKLEGPPPQVEVGKVLRYDLLAGRVNLFIDGNSMAVYLDEKPQLIDVCGFPVILRFCDGFHTVLLNGRPFPTDFGGLPMSVTVPGGRKHYLRLSGLSPNTKRAMLHFVRAKTGPGRDLQDGHPMPDGFPGAFRGRGGRGGRGGPMIMGRGGNRPPLFNMAPMMPPMGVGMDGIRHPLPPGTDMYPPMAPLTFETNSNPLDALANIMPSPSGDNYSNENSENHRYEIETPMAERSGADGEMTEQHKEPLDVQDLLSKLMMAGLLPAATVPEPKGEVKIEEIVDVNKTEEPKKAGKEPVDEDEPKESKSKEKLVKGEVKVTAKEKEEPAEKIIPPLETVDVSWNGLKERRDKLIAQICTGVQCGSCGLRFPPDQNVRYSQHLDWHFRQNRREKVNARVALSRKWYYDLSDWIQFAEIEDLEDRAQSLFEPLETDLEEQRSPGTVLNPDHYTVLSAGYEGAVCPQCNEGFESFFDEEKEEWRLRDAFVADGDETEAATLYHPICHQDFMAALQGKSTLQDVSPKEEPKDGPAKGEAVDGDVVMENAEAGAGGDDDEEVLIIKEGKPEPEVMDIDMVEEDEVTKVDAEESSSVAESGMDACESESITKKSLTENVIVQEKDTRKDSDDQNDESMICIELDDDDNNNAELNNKTETQLQLERETPETSSGTTQTHNIDTNTDTHSSSSEIQKPHEINLADSSNSNSSSTTTFSTNISVNILSSLGGGGGGGGEGVGSPATITIPDDEAHDDEEGASLFQSIPGQVFDIALGNSNQGFPSPRPETESPPTDHKRIIYESMKFDNPTPKIKIEPLDPDDEEDAGGSFSFDFLMKSNLEPIEVNLEEESSPPGADEPPAEAAAAGVDIDLTGDDEDTMDVNSSSAHSALDGNFQFSDQAPSHQIAPISKIRIRITDAVLSTDSQSPKNSPARTTNEDEAPSAESTTKVLPVPVPETDPQISKSPTQNAADEDGKDSSGGDGVVKKGIVHNIVLTSSNVIDDIVQRKERMDRLKPKLIDRKLVNYPPKQTGKEVSGLCTIS